MNTVQWKYLNTSKVIYNTVTIQEKLNMGNFRKVWKAGTGTLVVTIDKDEKDIMGIKEGDYVDMQIKEVIKKGKQTKNTEKKTPKQKQQEITSSKKLKITPKR